MERSGVVDGMRERKLRRWIATEDIDGVAGCGVARGRGEVGQRVVVVDHWESRPMRVWGGGLGRGGETLSLEEPPPAGRVGRVW